MLRLRDASPLQLCCRTRRLMSSAPGSRSPPMAGFRKRPWPWRVQGWTVEASSANTASLTWWLEISIPQCLRMAPIRSAGPAVWRGNVTYGSVRGELVWHGASYPRCRSYPFLGIALTFLTFCHQHPLLLRQIRAKSCSRKIDSCQFLVASTEKAPWWPVGTPWIVSDGTRKQAKRTVYPWEDKKCVG